MEQADAEYLSRCYGAPLRADAQRRRLPHAALGYACAVLESVDASDVYDYGYGEVRDFLLEPYRAGSYDWVVTDAPFRLAQEFVIKGLEVARIGVAIVARFISQGRAQGLDGKKRSHPAIRNLL